MRRKKKKIPKVKRVLVAGCRVGAQCRYDGSVEYDEKLMDKLREEDWFVRPVCPEMLGGLSIPRDPANIVGGDGFDVWEGKARVIDKRGRDMTNAYKRGARECLTIAKSIGATEAYLRERSPSCGVNVIVDEEGNEREGAGVLTALLESEGIEVLIYDEDREDEEEEEE